MRKRTYIDGKLHKSTSPREPVVSERKGKPPLRAYLYDVQDVEGQRVAFLLSPSEDTNGRDEAWIIQVPFWTVRPAE